MKMEYEFLIIRIILLTNIVVFLLYFLDFKLCQKGKKIPTILMFLPVMAGFVGASVGNYAFDTARNREKKISKFILGIVPAIFNWILVIIVYIVPQIILKLISRAIGIPLMIINILNYIDEGTTIKFNSTGGIVGIMLKVSIMSFFVIIIKKLEETGHLHGKVNYKFMTILLLLGGAPGALFGCIICNYRNRNECNTIKFEELLYGRLMWILGIVQWFIITMRIWNGLVYILTEL